MACTETLYIKSASTMLERINRIDQIILALELQVVNVAAGNSDIEEYSIDDGQVKIKTIYRSVDSITKAIHGFETLKNKLLNQLNGRVTVLRPFSGLR